VVGTTQTGSWLDDANARSRANVERWLCQNRDADTGRLYSTLSRQQRHRHSVQRVSHAHSPPRSCSRVSEAPDQQSRMERSVSETNVQRPSAADDFRPRDQHRMTPNRASVPRTPSMAGSAGAEGESYLGPSLVQLVAEIIEGLEQRSRDDSSAVWSGMRGTGTPATKIFQFQQLTTRVRNTDMVARSRATVEDRRIQDVADQKGTVESSGNIVIEQDKTRNDQTSEALSEKTLTGRREKREEEQKSSGIVPSYSVAVLRQRLLRAVEGNSSRRPVTERPSQRRRTTEGKQTETETGNFRSSASVSCSTGTTQRLCLDFLVCVYLYKH